MAAGGGPAHDLGVGRPLRLLEVHCTPPDHRRPALPLAGSDWFPRPDGEAKWPEERRLLDAEHAALRADVAALDPADVDRTPGGSAHTLAHLIAGAAAHDLYHAGQIQLMKRLAGEATLEIFR